MLKIKEKLICVCIHMIHTFEVDKDYLKKNILQHKKFDYKRNTKRKGKKCVELEREKKFLYGI